MTIITRENPTDLVVRPMPPMRPSRTGSARRRPAASRRPGGQPLQYRRTGVLMSRASHRRKPVTPLATVLLALVAAGITVWLGLMAHLSAGAPTPAPSPSRLAVVQLQMGESLEQLAQRVSPDAPVAAVVDQIKDLNELDTATVDAGRTLIAPVG